MSGKAGFPFTWVVDTTGPVVTIHSTSGNRVEKTVQPLCLFLARNGTSTRLKVLGHSFLSFTQVTISALRGHKKLNVKYVRAVVTIRSSLAPCASSTNNDEQVTSSFFHSYFWVEVHYWQIIQSPLITNKTSKSNSLPSQYTYKPFS